MWTNPAITIIGGFFSVLLVSFTGANGGEARNVKLSVYMETLCKDSRVFYLEQLYPVWNQLKDIMYMDINFYGKASDTPTSDGGYTFECQHGDDECDGNMLMACAAYYTDMETYLAFGDCIMDVFIGAAGGQLCSDKVGANYSALHTCLTTNQGQERLHEIGEMQHTLIPPLYYVPWILINDEFSAKQLHDAQKDLKKVVCDAYEGEKPDSCIE